MSPLCRVGWLRLQRIRFLSNFHSCNAVMKKGSAFDAKLDVGATGSLGLVKANLIDVSI